MVRVYWITRTVLSMVAVCTLIIAGCGGGGSDSATDTVAPVAGADITFGSKTASSLTATWGTATDNSTAQGDLSYKLVRSSASTSIDTVGEANAVTGADLVMDWSLNTTSYVVSGLAVSTNYYFAVLVRDASNNLALYSPQLTSITPVYQNLLVNPSFDSGPGAPWQEYSSIGGYQIIESSAGLPVTITPHTGNYAAWLGGDNSLVMNLWQTVTVPAGATELRVSGYCYITTEDSGGPWDYFSIQLFRTSDDALLETLLNYTNLDSTLAWTLFTKTAASSHAGEAIYIRIRSENDGNYVTSFFVDTLKLEALIYYQ